MFRFLGVGTVALGWLCLCNNSTAQVIVFDPANDFSLIANPSGFWSYGTFSPAAINPSTFALNAFPHIDQGLQFYSSAILPPPQMNGSHPPYVSHNPSSTPVTYESGTIIYQGNQMGMHPGQDGKYSVLRFIPPSSGDFSVAVTFSSIDFSLGTTTDVHLWKNSTALFNGFVNPGTSTSFLDMSLHLEPTDSLYYIVGFGPNLNWASDSTGLNTS